MMFVPKFFQTFDAAKLWFNATFEVHMFLRKSRQKKYLKFKILIEIVYITDTHTHTPRDPVHLTLHYNLQSEFGARVLPVRGTRSPDYGV